MILLTRTPNLSIAHLIAPVQKSENLQRAENVKSLSKQVGRPAQTEWLEPIILFLERTDSYVFTLITENWMLLLNVTFIQSLVWTSSSTLWKTKHVFSTLAADSNCWKVEIDWVVRNKTSSMFHHGLNKRVQMPFGLRIAPHTFQHAKIVILSLAKWQYALVLLDKIVVYYCSPSNHIPAMFAKCWLY